MRKYNCFLVTSMQFAHALIKIDCPKSRTGQNVKMGGVFNGSKYGVYDVIKVVFDFLTYIHVVVNMRSKFRGQRPCGKRDNVLQRCLRFRTFGGLISNRLLS